MNTFYISLAYLQVLLLPGFLFERFFLKFTGFLQRILSCFALSLLINYGLVISLTLLHLYTKNIFLIIFLIETGGLLFYWRSRQKTKQYHYQLFNKIKNILLMAQKNILMTYAKNKIKFYSQLLLWIIIFNIFYYFFQNFITNLGTSFTMVDDSTSWYSWSLAWLLKPFQYNYDYYPQLIPTNWSLIYLISDSTSQLLVKGFMPLFSIALLLTQIDLFFRRQEIGILISVIVTGILLIVYARGWLQSGYVDIPVTFFAFFSVYFLLQIQSTASWRTISRMVITGGIIAAGSAVTKQAGLYILLLYPILAILIILQKLSKPSFKKKCYLLLITINISLLIALPHYIYRYVTYLNHQQSSDVIDYVTNRIYKGVKPCQRCQNTLTHYYNSSNLHKKLGFLYDCLLVLVIILLLLNLFYLSSSTWITILIVIPYPLIWCHYFSYDIRNLFLSFPFIGLAIGNGIFFLCKKLD